MRKLLVGFCVFLLLFILSVFLFIPNYILISANKPVVATKGGLYRNMANEENWEKWWPGSYKMKNGGISHRQFFLGKHTYTIEEIQLSSFIISITKNNKKINTSLHIFPVKGTSVQLLWEGRMPTSFNPIKRLQKYIEAKQVTKSMNKIMEKMQSYFSKNESIYGIRISKVHVTDSILIFKNAISKGYPETNFIYDLVKDLKKYTDANKASQTGFPMLNITSADSNNYMVKVAIPVNRRLAPSGTISHKWMLGGGNILVTEVKGGYDAINEAFERLTNYVKDYHLVAPAIHFESLVTDRRTEPDSSKWITRLYYPIMY